MLRNSGQAIALNCAQAFYAANPWVDRVDCQNLINGASVCVRLTAAATAGVGFGGTATDLCGGGTYVLQVWQGGLLEQTTCCSVESPSWRGLVA
jgi:hypothetical protein